MIISQTPYRVSFAGGGTDLPAYYRREFGAALSATIDQHIYVTLHRRFESTIRVSYSRTEVARTIDEVQHELVREAMRMVEIDEPLEITTIGDVPSGTGMGSSSSLTVGLLAALYGYRHRIVSPSSWPNRPVESKLIFSASQSAAKINMPRPSAGSTIFDSTPTIPSRLSLCHAVLRRWQSWSNVPCWSTPARQEMPT